MHKDRRQLAGAGLLVASSVTGWALLTWMALNMGDPVVQLAMPGGPDWSATNVAALFGMWTVMMAAMMLPSAVPMVLTFVRLNMQRGEAGRALAFTVAYLLVWTTFGGLATVLQWMLQSLDWVDPMIVSSSVALNVALLLIAGAYQFSPLKRMCLAQCRSPVGFLLAEWKPRVGGAFTMGLRHGTSCTGCCWALMLLAFVGGVMNIAWIAALSFAVGIEKLAPRGELLGKLLGLALIATGIGRIVAILSGG
jgi:predicted metal-binding membrane protein